VKLVKFFVILFFDLIDKFHQKKILTSLKKNRLNISCFVDVGAHNGKYTDLIINNFQVNKVLMFEPQINIYKKIKKKYKEIKYIKIFNNAISNNNKKKKFYINRHDLTSSLVKIDEGDYYLSLKTKLFTSSNKQSLIKKVYDVQTKRLDAIIKKNNIKKIDLIKIDTEGHEKEVLLGLNKFIKNIHYILIEFRRDKIYFNYNPKEINNYLYKNNFILKETFQFPFTSWEDRIYVNKKF
jgi:FkbM family methyltransferase|tara:strand:+ start:3061 stop:3774 length:714 start_codon:yes stop_codon:yes gene_type:complete